MLDRRTKALAAFLAPTILLALAGCEHATPYQPRSAYAPYEGGYSDERLAPDRYRVSFSGNYLTSRETVEAYLLYRAAELTLDQGYDWFEVLQRQTDRRITRDLRPDPLYRPWYGPGYYGWRPYWRYHLRGQGWYLWDPWYTDPFWADRYDQREIEEYEAQADIRLGRGVAPPDGGRVFDARRVLEEIGPRVVRDHSGRR